MQLDEQQLRMQWLGRAVPTDDDVGVTATEHAVGNATEHDGVVATEHILSTGCYRAHSQPDLPIMKGEVGSELVFDG